VGGGGGGVKIKKAKDRPSRKKGRREERNTKGKDDFQNPRDLKEKRGEGSNEEALERNERPNHSQLGSSSGNFNLRGRSGRKKNKKTNNQTTPEVTPGREVSFNGEKKETVAWDSQRGGQDTGRERT